ncbi:MAG: FAD-dependent oxidoreductase [Desulfobacterales bacterium]|nr:FAD-dependent oxidoreductase [Desulfobacterales bacterium]
MKHPKDRLHKVIVIGATPAGITATNKLGELGIPVTLIDSDTDLDWKLSQSDWKLKSGVPFNHAHRPGLLRIMRNPGIQCVMPAEITSIKHTPQGFRVGLNKLQTFVDSERCTLCGRCVEICPVSINELEKAVKINSRRSLPGRPFIDKRKQPLCQADCPLGVNVQGYIALAKAGRFKEALELIRKDNVLPGICGRVCTHPCENACRRGELDETVAIRDIKRFVADYELSHPEESKLPNIDRKTKKIAVIGSGPAGLAAAADLAKHGYRVTVFEKESMIGGLLRYGIGPYRLPRNILDVEIEYISKLGVKFITSRFVDLSKDISELKKDFDAVILTAGTWADGMLGAPGEKLSAVEGCLSFLRRFYRDEIKELNGKTAVIGGGDSAIDAARCLVRLGVTPTILYRRRLQDMPADFTEIRAAQEEGIEIKDCTQVVGFIEKDGKLDRLQCMPTQPGKPDARGIPSPVILPGSIPFDLQFERAIVAIGQTGAFKNICPEYELNITDQGLIAVDECMRTHMPAVYAAGDAVSGPSTVVEAMASGRAVACRVHKDLHPAQEWNLPTVRPMDKEFPEIPKDIPSLARPTMPEMQPTVRRNNFSEVALGFTETQVISEAERCLQCGVCSECLQCVEVCEAIGAINHRQSVESSIEHAGAIIIADPDIALPIKGEDVIRAYGPKAAKSDLNAMILRGFAAAAKAMTLLGETSQRLKGHGISFSPPDPGLSPEIRLGVFVCRCNDSVGWLERMSEYAENLKSRVDVVHAQTLSAACLPESSAGILRIIREKGITRVVLAACVCCPLNFVCSACTQQRSRLKDALFTGTGISRSMVETCNIRGEALRIIKQDAGRAFSRFTGMMERSISRAKKLKPLPSPARNYNFATAVIGASEAAIHSAVTLAESGFEVFVFDASDPSLSQVPDHPNIHNFQGTTVKELSGTLGDFQVVVESSDFKQAIPVGAVILSEKSRKNIQYIHQEELPGHFIKSSLQKEGVTGIPFFYPGSTAIAGLYLADPPGISVSKKQKGAAAAVLTATVMPRGPRQSKGFTVVVDATLCRGCGRCIQVCPYQAVTLKRNEIGGWNASVDEALCKGCGNCISVCPSNAADSPYRNQAFLEQMLEEVLEGKNE